MNRIFRSLMLALIAVATYEAMTEAAATRMNLCFSQQRWYYADDSCTGDQIGYLNLNCNGQNAGGWGTQTPHFYYEREGGLLCDCEPPDWEDSGTIGCAAR